MRTETDLRNALTGLADLAPDPALARQRLLLAPARPARRRPRPLVLVAAVAVLALIAALVPYVLLRQTTAPADRRVPGYFGLISQVEPPPGWVVAEHGIVDGREYTLLGPTAVDQRSCDVTVYGRGRLPGPVPTGDPVQVGDRTGVYVAGSDIDPGRLLWPYADDAWATVSCFSSSATQNRQWSEELAPRVTITPGTLSVPFRLTALPTGYAVRNVATSTIDGRPLSGVVLSSPGQPAITLTDADGPGEPPGPGMPGVEQLTVRGHAVTVREDLKTVSIAVGSGYIRLEGGSDGQSWAAGERDRLLEVADHLRFADDVTDPSTWYDARRALP